MLKRRMIGVQFYFVRYCANLLDIGANLLDEMYLGIYNGKKAHEPDISQVLARANNFGVEKIIVTAGSLVDVKGAIALTKQHPSI